jgi:hypothetical protein
MNRGTRTAVAHHITNKLALVTAALLLCALGSAAQELDSQVHIVPVVRVQAAEKPALPAAGTQDVNSQTPGTQNTDAPRNKSQDVNPHAVDAQRVDSQTVSPQDQTQQPAPTAKPEILVPAGTTISLVLSQAISFKHVHPGDSVNFQTTFPVAADGQLAIPPGTYVRGIVEKITRRDKHRGVLAMRLRSAFIVFSNGYTVVVGGPVNAEPVLAQFKVTDPPNGTPAPVLAAGGVSPPIVMNATDPTLPPLPPFPDHSGIRTAFIVTAVVTTVAIVAGTIWLFSRDHEELLMAAGTPMEIILSGPVVLETSRVAEAVQIYGGQIGGASPRP